MQQAGRGEISPLYSHRPHRSADQHLTRNPHNNSRAAFQASPSLLLSSGRGAQQAWPFVRLSASLCLPFARTCDRHSSPAGGELRPLYNAIDVSLRKVAVPRRCIVSRAMYTFAWTIASILQLMSRTKTPRGRGSRGVRGREASLWRSLAAKLQTRPGNRGCVLMRTDTLQRDYQS